jgi:murein DD-endopeptidase MepM/ murein hydrolase activator NlpD
MPRGEERRPSSVGRGVAYPMVVLLASALAAGCGTPAAPTVTWPTITSTPGGSPTVDATTAAPATPSTAPTASASATPPAVKTNLRYFFPVQTANVDYHPTHSEYPGTDIFANCGSPVVAVTDGKILEVSRVDRYEKKGPQGPNNGGKSVSLLGDDGVRYYGSHLVELTAGIDAGVRVRAGQRLGSVGHTGNANNVCHLHFGISPPCGGTADWWIRRGVVWPADFLNAWRKQTNTSPASKVTAWQRDKGCPKAP